MIRQELGRAELRHVKDDQVNQMANLAELLSDTIMPLLPRKLNANSQSFDVRGMVNKIVDKCVNLANLMTAEQYFFDCSIMCAGEEPADASIKDGQSGRVFMCTFPGLSRRICRDGKTVFVPLVKHSVELESIVWPRQNSD